MVRLPTGLIELNFMIPITRLISVEKQKRTESQFQNHIVSTLSHQFTKKSFQFFEKLPTHIINTTVNSERHALRYDDEMNLRLELLAATSCEKNISKSTRSASLTICISEQFVRLGNGAPMTYHLTVPRYFAYLPS